MTKPVALELELPMPDALLSPNARTHYHEKAPVTAQHRYDAMQEARAARYRWVDQHRLLWEPLKTPVTATITFIFKTKGARDFDNFLARCKPYWDGMKDAGVIVDDNCWVLQLVLLAEYEPMKMSHKPARVKIRLEGAP